MGSGSEDSASLWYVPHLMVTSVMALESTSSVVFHSHIELLMIISALSVLYHIRHPCIQVWGIESYVFLKSIQVIGGIAQDQ